MALLYIDSFDHYATGDIQDKWVASVGGIIDPTYARHGIGGFKMGPLAQKTFPEQTSFMCGFALKPTNLGNGITRIVSTGHVSAVAGYWRNWSLWAHSTGQLEIFCGGDITHNWGTSLGFTDAPFLLKENVWSYVEVKVTTFGAASTFTLRVNNLVALTGVGSSIVANGISAWNYVELGGAGGLWGAADDFYLGTLETGTYTDFLGEVRIDAHYPTGPGNYAQWARVGVDSGNNWDQVNETAPNDDTDANEAASAGLIDTFGCTDFVPEGNALLAVQHVYSAAKTDAGVATSTSIIRIGTTDYEGDAVAPGQSTYAYFLQMHETPPSGGTWSEATFESMEVGYKRLT